MPITMGFMYSDTVLIAYLNTKTAYNLGSTDSRICGSGRNSGGLNVFAIIEH